MTRKDYKVIAAAIKVARITNSVVNVHPIANVVNVLCLALAADNPRFDEAKFRAAVEGK